MTSTRHSTVTALSAALALSTLVACGESDGDAGETTSSSAAAAESATAAAPTPSDDGATQSMDRPLPLPAPEDPIGGLPTGPVPDSVLQRDDVQAAIAAEAERSGVARSTVTVAGYADVTWNDGSIGCPEPGMVYTQALVPGHQLILDVDGQLHSYHAAEGQEFRYCAQPRLSTGAPRSDS